jgi:hypothetical protein
MNRIEASKLGLVTYSTGKPCKQGHICDRYTINGVCVKCSSLRAKKQQLEIAENLKKAREKADYEQ